MLSLKILISISGVGSGVCVQHGSTPLNLVTLYTATKAERLAQASTQGQPKVNKLISPYSDDSGPELTQAVHSLCQQADAFLLVIDTANLDSGKDKLLELGSTDHSI
jgi:hypothetical protein